MPLPSTDKTVKSTKFFVLFSIHRFHFSLSSSSCLLCLSHSLHLQQVWKIYFWFLYFLTDHKFSILICKMNFIFKFKQIDSVYFSENSLSWKFKKTKTRKIKVTFFWKLTIGEWIITHITKFAAQLCFMFYIISLLIFYNELIVIFKYKYLI